MSSSEQFGSTTLGGTTEGLGTTEGGYSTGYVPLNPQPTGFESVPGAGGGAPSTTDVAKDQAGNVAGGAADAAQHVAGVAKEQAGQVTAEAGRQVRQLVGQAQSELSIQAQAQQEKLAGGLRAVAEQLKSMANNSDQPGVATDLAHQAADKAHQFASWLDDRDPRSVLDEVRSYARRRPGTFLAIALGAGLVAGRLTRGLAAGADEMSGSGRPSNPQRDALGRIPTAPQFEPVLSAPSYTSTPAVGYGDSSALSGSTYAAESDVYGTGEVPDWTGKPGSDVLGDAR